MICGSATLLRLPYLLTGLFAVALLGLCGGCKTTNSNVAELKDEGTFPTVRRKLENYTCPESEQAKVIFFDADSTLRVSRSGSLYPTRGDDVYILPGVAEKIIEKGEQGYLIAIASNQGNVPRTIAFNPAQAALVTTAEKLAALGATFHYIDFYSKCDDSNRDHVRCAGASGPDNEGYKKPALGMAQQLEQALQQQCPGVTVNKESSWYIGDAGYKRGETHPDGRPGDDHSNSDRGFAGAILRPLPPRVAVVKQPSSPCERLRVGRFPSLSWRGI